MEKGETPGIWEKKDANVHDTDGMDLDTGLSAKQEQEKRRVEDLNNYQSKLDKQMTNLYSGKMYKGSAPTFGMPTTNRPMVDAMQLSSTRGQPPSLAAGRTLTFIAKARNCTKAGWRSSPRNVRTFYQDIFVGGIPIHLAGTGVYFCKQYEIIAGSSRHQLSWFVTVPGGSRCLRLKHPHTMLETLD